MTFQNVKVLFIYCFLQLSLSLSLKKSRIQYDKLNNQQKYSDTQLKTSKNDVMHQQFALMEESVYEQFQEKKREFKENDSRAPPYMIELYQRFSSNRYAHPSSNIVRSFLNEEVDEFSGNYELESLTKFSEIFLRFNVTIPIHEKVVLAELRLFAIVKQKQGTGAFVKIAIYEDDEENVNGHFEKVLIKHIYKENNGWETFDLTDYVIKRLSTNNKHVCFLRVQIDDIIPQMLIDTSQHIQYQPLLVIYSDDVVSNVHRRDSNELDNMIDQEVAANFKIDNNLGKIRNRRGLNRKNYCRKREMTVDFKEIGYDWIIAPKSYQAFHCSGRCIFPLTDRWSPTKHAVIQILVHEFKPKQFPKPCCVANNLEPISLLYINEGVITYKHKYDGMVVKDCACR